MAHFSSYDTSDGTATPLAANGTTIAGPIQTDVYSQLCGSIFADQAGTLYVEQSFDNGAHFDISVPITVTANAGQSFNETIIAPVAQVRFVNGGTDQGVMRLFVRAFGNRGT
jgi:hypothetical protein